MDNIDYKKILEDLLDPIEFEYTLTDGSCSVKRLSDGRIFRCEWRQGPHNIGYKEVLKMLIR